VHSTLGTTVLQDSTGSNVARCSLAMWHDRATLILRDLIVRRWLRRHGGEIDRATLILRDLIVRRWLRRHGGEIIIFHFRALEKWIFGVFCWPIKFSFSKKKL